MYFITDTDAMNGMQLRGLTFLEMGRAALNCYVMKSTYTVKLQATFMSSIQRHSELII